MIPFLDLKKINELHRQELLEVIARVINSGKYVLGENVETFERAFADYTGVKYAIGTGNGLDALTLIMRAYKEQSLLKEGDEILVPANTYIASILAITENRLKPILVEPDIYTYNLDTRLVKEKISRRTKGILAVHLYGRVAYSEEMRNLAREFDLILMEDSAQAAGASYRGAKTGSLGHAGGISFYPSKNLGALGDAGAVTTDDEEFAAIVRALGNYGSHKKYHNLYQGINSRLDELQAAVLLVKLKYLDEENKMRRKIAEYYLREIKNEQLILPIAENDESHVWHLFVVRTEKRDQFKTHLQNNKIETMIHYPIPPHKQPAYADWNSKSYPVSEEVHRTAISIPLYPTLTKEEISHIIDACNSF